MKFKRVALLILVLLVSSITYSQQSIMTWKAEKPLQWEDFTGVVDSSSEFSAATSAGITYSYRYTKINNTYSFKFDVAASIDKNKSWTKLNKQTPELLRHEQVHFDLAELYSRQLLEEFTSHKFTNNYKEEIKQITDTVFQELTNSQLKYDEETNHGRKEEKQQEWEAYIKRQLLQ